MIRVAICEDNPKHQKQIESCLKQYEESHDISFQITVFSDGIDLVSEYSCQFDLILLDIEMKHMNGVEAARKVREKDKEVFIIFITNLAQFAIQGYEVEAKGFLLKPVKYLAVEQQLNKVCLVLEKKKEDYITLNFAGGMKKIGLSEISYIESEGHYLNIHVKGEVIRILSSLKEMEQKLPEQGFARCNNGTLVNLRHVESVSKNDLQVGGDLLTVSRGKKKSFMEALTNYI